MRAIDLRKMGMDDKDTVLECYVFNPALDEGLDDGTCIHCRKYLTIQCEHIDEFLDNGDGEEDE